MTIAPINNLEALSSIRTKLNKVITRTVDNITDLLALSPSNGDVVKVLGYTNVGDGGGQVVQYDLNDTTSVPDGGTIFAGPGGDNVFTVLTHSGNVGTGRWKSHGLLTLESINVLQFGVIGNYIYHNTGTNTENAFQRAINGAENLALLRIDGTTRKRIRLVIPPLAYKLNGPLVVSDYVDLDGQNARLTYVNTSNRADVAVLTISSASNARHIVPAVAGWWLPYSPSEAEEDTAVAVLINKAATSSFYFQTISNAAVGLRLLPSSGSYVGHCSFHHANLNSCRRMLDLRGGIGTNWVNENSFYDFNFTPSSNIRSMGSVIGVTLDKIPGGYSGQNNNRIYSPCFQVGDSNEFWQLTPGKNMNEVSGSNSHAINHRYHNIELDYEYQLLDKGSGTIATVPVHTSGSVIDASGVEFRYVGPYFHSPVFLDGAGYGLSVYSPRWETGYGPFAMVKGSHNLKVYNSFDFENYALFNIAKSPQIDVTSLQTSVIGVNATCDWDKDKPETINLKNFHKRVICSSTHMSAAGFTCKMKTDVGVGTQAKAEVNSIDYYTDFIKLGGNTGSASQLAIWIDIEGIDGFSLSRISKAVSWARGEFVIQCWDKNWQKIEFLDTDTITFTSSCQAYDATNFSVNHNYASDYFNFYKGTGTTLKYVSVMISAGHTDFKIEKINHGRGADTRFPNMGLTFVSPFGEDAINPKYRTSYGTPVRGWFEGAGEEIKNLNTGSGQPVSWYVKTPGILAKAWTQGESSLAIGEMRASNNTIYAAENTGTCGATPPSGIGSGISDGTVSWRSFATEAVLIDSNNTSIDTISSGDILSLINLNNAVQYDSVSNGTFIVPPNSGVYFPVGGAVEIHQIGSGVLTVTPSGSATIQARNGTDTGGQYAVAILRKTSTDTWILGGDVA